MIKIYLPRIISSFIALFIGTTCIAQVFVKHDATGANDGSSWTNAYTDLTDALNDSPDEIWVAAGTYLPGGTNPDTLSTFAIQNDVELYGGFDGTETSLSEREPANNLTILSGDLAGDDVVDDFVVTRDDNVRHVVYVDSLLSSVTIDGFIVSGGHTNDFPDGPYFLRAGGGIYGLSPITIKNCLFMANFGRSGGAILLGDQANNSTVENCTFLGNMSTAQGACIHPVGLADFTVKNCQFTENYTARGAIYPLYCVNLLIEDCEFSANFNDGGFGGAIFSWANINFILQGCNFSDNFAGNAGAIYFDERELPPGNPDNLQVIDCTFSENITSGFGGGAIYMFEASMTIEDCEFTSNISSNGSHLFQNSPGGEVIIRGCDFFDAQNSGWGGAATAYGLDCQYLFEDCLFEDNVTANLGGAVNNGFGAIATYDGCVFSNNSSTTSAGGALSLQNDSTTVIVIECEFSDNKSSSAGGAIFAGTGGSSCILMVDDSEFFANASESSFGGAIDIGEYGDDDISTLTLSNSIFGFNSALDQGGAVSIVDADTEITSCLFFDNFTLGEGRGTISINASDSNSVNAKLLHCTIANNNGVFSNGLSQWTGLIEASLITDVQNCIFQGAGSTVYAVEDGFPILNSLGGNMSDDATMVLVLDQPEDLNSTATDFVNPDNFDFNLIADSPAIDAGVADGAPEFDLAGNPRVNLPDIGALEYQGMPNWTEELLTNDGMLSIFPNPVRSSYTNVLLENSWTGNIEIRVVDIDGRLIKFMEIEKSNDVFEIQLPLKNIKTSIYQLAISNGESVVVERLIRI